MIYDPDDRDRLTGEPKNSYEARIERLEAELADLRRTHVKLDVDVEHVREIVAEQWTWWKVEQLQQVARHVLAALEGGPATDDDLRKMGYVKLDVDVLERMTVEDGGSKPDPWTGEAIQAEPIIRGKAIEGCRTYLPLGDYFLIPARQVLAALDGETTE